ncbi:hypothetical protein EJ065_0012 [Corallococcus coralloides]|uniref:Uncharacterized protein n=1 Tax=Corallococcus coralloides TaxID=184914 RepID=A0A410RI74_CORCK|nr:hypothetical protein EJ065_0012 [Corallococcus coralloides]
MWRGQWAHQGLKTQELVKGFRSGFFEFGMLGDERKIHGRILVPCP